MKKIPRSFGTHDGTFHADEVTACALLLVFNLIDEDKVFRSRDPHILNKCEYICDVGGIYDPNLKIFDHHQVDYQGRHSSAGMVLEYLKDQNIMTQTEYDLLNHGLVMGIDAHDNGRETQIPGICTFSHVISNFTPIHYEADDQTQNAAFMQALAFVKGHLTRMLARLHYIQSCKQMVFDSMMAYKDCLMFDKSIPWIDSFFELGGIDHPALFVIMPSNKHWKLRGIPPNLEEKMKVRMPLPQRWAGLLEGELKKVSGIPGAIFCHKGRFISVWETREDAIKALEYTLKSGE